MKEPWTEGHSCESHLDYPAWTYLEAAGVVSRVPCELVGIFVTCGAAACDVNVFNGPNAQSPKVCDLDAQANRTMPFLPPEHILCSRGLYVEFDAKTKSVTVQWRPLPAGWRP